MADPLSIAASVAGLASFGLQVSSGIAKYLDAIDCRKSELESATNNLDALTQVLHIINRHANHLPLQVRDASPSAVQSTLKLCTAQLEALEALLAKLSDDGGNKGGILSRANKARKKLAYPFDRDKLAQIGAKLAQSVQILHLALQVLHIDVSTHIFAAQSSILSTHVSITNIEERLGYLTHIAERIERQQLYSHNSHVTYDTAPRKFISRRDDQISEPQSLGHLVSKPGRLRELCDSLDKCDPAETSSRIVYRAQEWKHSEELEIGSSSLIEPPGSGLLTCNCQPHRVWQRKRLFWSSLELFRDTRMDGYHLPSCPISCFTNKSQQSWGVRHVTVSQLLGYAVQLSFSLAFGSGGFSMGPTISFQATVDERVSPAFQAANMLGELTRKVSASLHFEYQINQSDIDKTGRFLRAAMLKIETSFHERKASPTDIDRENRTMIYPLLGAMYGLRCVDKDLQEKGFELLRGLMRYRIPVDCYDIYGQSALCFLIRQCSSELREASRILLDGVTDVPLLLMRKFVPKYAKGHIYHLHSHSNHQRNSSVVAEGMDCGYLSKKILSNDLTRTQELLNSCPDTLKERNLFGHSPLHLSVENPLILRTILVSTDPRTLDSVDISGYTAIEYALYSSSFTCTSSSPARIHCRRCGCSQSTAMLLKADCAITTQPNNLPVVLRETSIRCKKRFIKGLKNRRDRLMDLSKQCLPKSTYDSLDLVEGQVLDSQAPMVYKALLYNDVKIPSPLFLSTDEDMKAFQSHWSSVYSNIEFPEDAKLFFNMGFCDIDALDWRGLPPLANLDGFHTLDYLAWLVDHGADIFRPLHPIHVLPHRSLTTSAHYVFLNIGSRGHILDDQCGSVHSLNCAVLPMRVTDDCSCYCSDQGCTPFLIMLKAMVYSWSYIPFPTKRLSLQDIGSIFSIYMDLYHRDLQVTQHMEAVRYFTFASLDIQHTCRHENLSTWTEGQEPAAMSADDIDHIHAEQHEIYELLESLIRLFEAEIMEILSRAGSDATEIIHFWRERWPKRMQEEIGRLNGRDVSEDQKLAAEELGVVWHTDNSETVQEETPELRVGDPGFFEDYFERLNRIGRIENES